MALPEVWLLFWGIIKVRYGPLEAGSLSESLELDERDVTVLLIASRPHAESCVNIFI